MNISRINKYLNTIPSEQRNSVAWTLQRMAGDYGFPSFFIIIVGVHFL